MNNNQIRTHVRTTQPKLRCSRVVGALGSLLLRLLCEPRQPFGKFIAAGQTQPAMLHVKIILDLRWAQGSFRLPLAFLRMAKALADFLAEALEHDLPPKRLVQAGAAEF